ncbi:MAG: 4'-phosphopantetheinyl transferase superfamily protein [Lachnospiraceae bacterium]|nr:4'-phosphopantetheinyl transferase superfamily protein [Lachnospiraceae bacterium]
MKTRIYTADTDQFRDAETYSRIYEALPESRKSKISRFRREEDRLRSLAAGALLLRLARDEGLPGDLADLTENAYGKPFFSGHPDVQFSLSHSGTKVLLAASDRPVGCDVEEIRTDWNYMSIVKRYFAPEEYARLTEETDPEARALLFYRLWTLKESFLKETGRGLYLPLENFRIIFEKETDGALRIRVTFPETHDPAVSGDVFFLSDAPGDGCAYAFCIAGDGAELSGKTFQKLLVPYFTDL